jgi:predicted nuclease of predicted toxin-antitoxin system
VKLLFDENLSPKLVGLLAADFPESRHLEHLGMRGAKDSAIWEHAARHGFTIVSKDDDFRQRAFLLGPPPKIVWLAVGNARTQDVAALLKQSVRQLEAFLATPDEGVLVLYPLT